MSKNDDLENELSEYIDSQRRILNSVYDDFFGPLNVPAGVSDLDEAKKAEAAIDAAKAKVDAAYLARNLTKQAVNDTSKAYSKLGREIAAAIDYISDNSEKTTEVAKKIENTSEATTKTAKSIEELTSSYTSAKEAVKDYSSELSSLISLQKELSEGNEMSSLEMPVRFVMNDEMSLLYCGLTKQ